MVWDICWTYVMVRFANIYLNLKKEKNVKKTHVEFDACYSNLSTKLFCY